MYTLPRIVNRVVLPLIVLTMTISALQAEETKGNFYGARPTEYPSWFKPSFLSLQEDLAEATQAHKRLMLLFTQNGCPYCNALVERNLAQKDIHDAVRMNLDVIHINMWGDSEVTGLDGKHYSEKSLAVALKVQFTPTILFFDEQGKMILRVNGYLPPERFKIAIDYVTQKKEMETGYREYVAARAPRATSGALQAEAFFSPAPFDLARGAHGKPVAVFFEQPDCPDCVTLHEKVLRDPEIRQSLGKFHAVQLDMWSPSAVTTPDGKQTTTRDWVKALGVNFAPTIVVFNRQGTEVIRSEAMFKVFHTRGIFDYALTEGYKEQPSFQRWLSARAEHLREQGQDVDIWSFADDPAKK